MCKEQVLWGMTGGTWIKIAGGSLRECRRVMRERMKERGWAALVILWKGVHPTEE